MLARTARLAALPLLVFPALALASPAPIPVTASPVRVQAATLVFQNSPGHSVVILGGAPNIEVLDDIHTTGIGLLSGFDLRYSNRGTTVADLSISFYVGSPADDPPGALLAGPYVLSSLPVDGSGVSHTAHVDTPDAPIIGTSDLWVGYTSTNGRAGFDFNTTSPTVGTTHDALFVRPPDTPQTNPEHMNIAVYLDSYVGVPSPVAGRFDLEAPRPDPVVESCRFEFRLPQAEVARLELYDSDGRRVRSLVDGPRPAGEESLTWDGHDARGARARAGVYWARLQTSSGTRVRRFVVL